MVHTWITKHLVRSEQAAATQIWDWVGISEGSGQDPFSVTSLLVMILVSWSDYHGISKCKAVCCKTRLLSDFCTKIPEMFMVGTNYKAHHISQKKQHISIYARNLFIAYTQPHQPKWSKMYKKTRKWWDNQWITLLPSMQDWTVCYQHLSARFFWTRPRKGDLPCRSTNLHVWATKVLRKGSVSWCLPSKMREERLILAIAERDILNDSVCFWLHSGKCVIIRFCACSIRFRFRFSRQRCSGCILGCRVGS